jgi:hypothetical protein
VQHGSAWRLNLTSGATLMGECRTRRIRIATHTQAVLATRPSALKLRFPLAFKEPRPDRRAQGVKPSPISAGRETCLFSALSR